MRLVYVGGTGRSGSTLLDRLLGELPRVCSLGEVTQLWQRVGRDDVLCGCGVSFAGCAFWRQVGDVAFGGWRRVDLHRVGHLYRAVGRTRHAFGRFGGCAVTRRRSAGRRRDTRELTDYYARVYAAAAAVTGAAVVVDASKSPGLGLALRQTAPVELRLVHLVRDPRGVAHSWTRHRASAERRDGGTMLRIPPLRSAVQWTAHNGLLSLLAPREGGVPPATPAAGSYRLRYEDLAARPRATIRALATFIGIELPEATLSYLEPGGAWLRPRHGVAGNPMRFTSGRVALHPDQTWRTALPPAQRRLVSTVCAPLLPVYGYPLRTGGAT